MSLIDRFLTHELKVLRQSKGSYVMGRFVPGPEEELTVYGSLQPTTARELKLNDEGNRLRQYFKFYSDRPVLVDNTATLAQGDRLIINGEQFRAMALTPWENTDLDYFMTVVWREPQQSSDGKGQQK